MTLLRRGACWLIDQLYFWLHHQGYDVRRRRRLGTATDQDLRYLQELRRCQTALTRLRGALDGTDDARRKLDTLSRKLNQLLGDHHDQQ